MHSTYTTQLNSLVRRLLAWRTSATINDDDKEPGQAGGRARVFARGLFARRQHIHISVATIAAATTTGVPFGSGTFVGEFMHVKAGTQHAHRELTGVLAAVFVERLDASRSMGLHRLLHTVNTHTHTPNGN